MKIWGGMTAVLAAGLTAAIIWASAGGSILEEGAAIVAMPWGVVALADLYVGFVIAASLILIAEPRRPLGVLLALLMFILGNVVLAAWAAWRAPLLVKRLRGLSPPG